MRLPPAIARSAPIEAALSCLIALYIRLVHATGRWAIRDAEAPLARLRAGRPIIVCFWHGRMLMLPCAWPRGAPVRILVSGHRDGRLIARTLGRLGIGAVTGSSTRGALGALREMLRALGAGTSIGITPDGPQGPRMRAGPGALAIARHAGVPVFPAAYGARRRRLFGSWDRFLMPLPCAGGVYLWGAPITVPPDADAATMEAARCTLEARLNALTREADRLCGHAPPEPAAPPLGAGADGPLEAGVPGPDR